MFIRAYAGPEVDVWSCGVILYALLCGSLPFDDELVPNLFKKIKHGNFTIPGHLSENARRLIVRMLAVDPAARISLKEVRRHAWTKMPLPFTLWRPSLTGIDEDILSHVSSVRSPLLRNSNSLGILWNVKASSRIRKTLKEYFFPRK